MDYRIRAVSALIVIPARWGSTRFPGKPLVKIAGRTLIERVYARAIRSIHAHAVYVATDDERIADHVRQFGGRVVMTGEAATGTDRIAAALDAIERELRQRFEVVVNVQGDEPLIDVQSVDRIIRTLLDSNADIVTLACPIISEEEFHSPDVVKVVVADNGDALYFSRAPIPHGARALARRHVGIYGYRSGALRAFTRMAPSDLERAERLEQLRGLQNGLTIRVLETTAPHLGVDRPEDVVRVEAELAHAPGES
jgi:3-deoxy-manno-octulosonate cytidylyltransferase (CMP-KDO synthetase)